MVLASAGRHDVEVISQSGKTTMDGQLRSVRGEVMVREVVIGEREAVMDLLRTVCFSDSMESISIE